jgi:hypothetical protein
MPSRLSSIASIRLTAPTLAIWRRGRMSLSYRVDCGTFVFHTDVMYFLNSILKTLLIDPNWVSKKSKNEVKSGPTTKIKQFKQLW